MWIFIFIKLISLLIKNSEKITFGSKKDPVLIIFWLSIYIYCTDALFKLKIIEAVPIYGVVAFFLFILTLTLVLIDFE